jgi:hypothetical protein
VLQHSKVAAPSGPLQLDRDAPISSWCCFNKGHISMRVAADSDSFLPGQAINVSTQVGPAEGPACVHETVLAALSLCSLQQVLHALPLSWFLSSIQSSLNLTAPSRLKPSWQCQ